MVSVAVSPRFKTVVRATALALATLLGASPVLAQAQPAPQQTQPAPSQQKQAPAPAPSPGPSAPAGTAPQGTAGEAPSQAPPAEPAPPVLSPAEREEIEAIQRPIAEVKTEVDRLVKAVERNLENEEELTRLRGALIEAFRKTRATRDALKPKSEALHQQIEQLGPPPTADAPESAEVAAERARLNALASEIDGALKNTELLVVRMRQLRDTVQTARQNIFASQLLKRSPSPVAPTTWFRLVDDTPGALRQVSDTLSGWLTLAARKWTPLAALLASVAVLFLVLTALVRWFIAYRLDRPREQPPSFFVQAATVGWVAPLLAVPPFAAVNLLGAGLDWLNLLTLEVGQIAETAFPALYIFIGVAALTRAMLQPRRPVWRLVDLSTPAARRVTQIITSIAAVFSLDLVLQEAVRRLFLPLSIGVMEMALASIAIGVLMLQLVRTPFEPKSVTTGVRHGSAEASIAGVPSQVPRLRPYLIKLPVLAAGVAILALTLLGYIGLGRFITKQVLVTGSAIAIVLVVHLAIRALLGAPGTGVKPLATVLHEHTGLDPKQGSILTRALSILLNVGLAVVALPLILITWGYTPQEAWMWMRALVFGFQIGEFHVSLARILLAAALFFVLAFATRIAQRWIDRGVSKSQRIDQGIANSIHTAVGYTGFIIAALAAISYGGLDITNFAIVAGALSVGIGFGLQSIINNFVSGLILLVERPIKVGDRVTVKDQQGFVRRISVRSTEIETFDKASVIVPNSDLITSAVTNWTHRNALGTVAVKVRVGYQSDPERVRDILQKVASECPLLMQHPPPSVNFDNFGADGLEFSVGGVIPDVGKGDAAKSDLRYRILKAFRAAGIEMPYAQHDIHLRDLDAVRTVLTRLAEERARQAGVTVADEGTAEERKGRG
jgi:potassium efflux system protein